MDIQTLTRELDAIVAVPGEGPRFTQALIDVLFDPDTNGLDGIIRRFCEGGYDAGSWIANPEAAPLLRSEVEQVLGSVTLQRLADRAGVSRSSAAAGAAFAIPRIIGLATRGRHVPDSVPPWLASDALATAPLLPASGRSYSTGRVVLLCLVLLVGQLAIYRSCSSDLQTADSANDALSDSSQPSAALDGLHPGFTARQLVGALNLARIEFAPDMAAISVDGRALLDRCAAVMRTAPPGTIIEIGAHTANSVDAASSQSLSQRRAEALRDYLVFRGVPPQMLLAKGYGQSAPVDTNDSETGRSRNNRIEFQLIQ